MFLDGRGQLHRDAGGIAQGGPATGWGIDGKFTEIDLLGEEKRIIPPGGLLIDEQPPRPGGQVDRCAAGGKGSQRQRPGAGKQNST